MFATVSIVSFIIVTLALGAHYVVFGPRRVEGAGDPGRRVQRWCAWERWLLGLTVLSFFVLAGTGFAAGLFLEALDGWLLWVHSLAAPVFAVGLALMAITWAERSRFASHDGPWLKHGGGYFAGPRNPPAGRFDAGQKLFFWVILLLGFLTLGSIMVTMVPVFGYRGQEVLYGLHRYSALGLVVAVLVHGYITMLAKPGTWRAVFTGTVSARWAEYYHALWWETINSEREQDHDK